ncbi:hypothetical protein Tco_0638134 [Tanacetum coccineum]
MSNQDSGMYKHLSRKTRELDMKSEEVMLPRHNYDRRLLLKVRFVRVSNWGRIVSSQELAGLELGGLPKSICKDGDDERRLATELGYGFPIGDPWITDGISSWPFASESVLPSQCPGIHPMHSFRSCADNRPPMLEKDMYDSWKSRMELYMMNRQHGRMILESIENGPLIWPTIEENGVTRPNKYSELSAMEAIQADYDIKAKNIILQGLPPEVYALVSDHKVAKELWERIQLLMQGTSLTKHER